MTIDERFKYLRLAKKQYLEADRLERGRLLDDMGAITGLHRKSLIRLMSSSLERKPRRKQRGLMIWVEEADDFYVFYEGEDAQAFQTFDWVLEITLKPGASEENRVGEDPPPGLFEPVSGFGMVWRGEIEWVRADVRERLGWATAPEAGFTTAYQCATPMDPRLWSCFLRGPRGEVLSLRPQLNRPGAAFVGGVVAAAATACGAGGSSARLDDGLLDIFVAEERPCLKIWALFSSIFQGTHIEHAKGEYFQVREVAVEAEEPVSLSLDGELLGSTPARFSVVPGALKVICPPVAERTDRKRLSF